MMRARLARIVSSIVPAAFVVIYIPTLFEIAEIHGFWFMLPAFLLLLVGLFISGEWLEERLHRKHQADTEIHNAAFPSPSVRAGDWDAWLVATPEAIEEALNSTKGGRHPFLRAVNNGADELLIRWYKDGWHIEVTPRNEYINKIAVKPTSKWAGKEVTLKGKLGFFKRWPEGRVDEKAAKQILAHFLGRGELPSEIAWSTIRYPTKA
ncbi:hypothetical protein [Erythrobacter sp. F6033]|uniref:hypothetical protein n=1 Tax=Erythrobacter sp. F6033 TaxID=2926401 RepID=UPI001FF0F4BF|nr:hypothetical protein [Erythrobacter sp. F6033]MCK0127277.1 hypothetical protein [Erythrobacter sp. F6033]